MSPNELDAVFEPMGHFVDGTGVHWFYANDARNIIWNLNGDLRHRLSWSEIQLGYEAFAASQIPPETREDYRYNTSGCAWHVEIEFMMWLSVELERALKTAHAPLFETHPLLLSQWLSKYCVTLVGEDRVLVEEVETRDRRWFEYQKRERDMRLQARTREQADREERRRNREAIADATLQRRATKEYQEMFELVRGKRLADMTRNETQLTYFAHKIVEARLAERKQ